MSWRNLAYLALGLLVLTQTGSASCPCKRVDHALTCREPGTISRLPDDLQLTSCGIDPAAITSLVIANQPVTHLDASSVQVFTNLWSLAIVYSNVTHVGSMETLTSLKELDLTHNRIESITPGALDLPSLTSLELNYNPIEQYETTAWYVCPALRASSMLEFTGKPVIEKLASKPQTVSYCAKVARSEDHGCQVSGDTFNCTSQEDMSTVACNLLSQNFKNILFDFPVDSNQELVDDYKECETSPFFQEYSTPKGLMTAMKRRILNIYDVKYNLGSLLSLTSKKTEEVNIRADTVYLNSPLTIHYRLNIQARRVILKHPITMQMTHQQFENRNSDLEAWAMREEVMYSDVVMRTRKYGLVTIMHQDKSVEMPPLRSGACQIPRINATATRPDLTSWYDFTHVSLQYICARTLVTTGSNMKLAHDMARYYLAFGYDASVINDQRIFMAAQKFKRVQELAAGCDPYTHRCIHNVPRYSVNQIDRLADVLHGSMKAYMDQELAQETQLGSAVLTLQSMKVNFENIEMQQQLYFDNEQNQLEAIWADSGNKWKFNFAHRNQSDSMLGNMLGQLEDQAERIQKSNMEELLTRANESVRYIENVVTTYQDRVDRMEQMVQGSIRVQGKYFSELQGGMDNMTACVDNFRAGIEEYKRKQIVNLVMGIFSAGLDIFVGIATLDPTKAISTVQKLTYVFQLVQQFKKFADMMLQITGTINSLNPQAKCGSFNIANCLETVDSKTIKKLSDTLNTDFKNALQTSVDLKLAGPSFDDMSRQAKIKLDELNHQTKFGISGTSDLMMNMQGQSDIAQRLIVEAADFAQLLLKLAEKKEDVKLAKLKKEISVGVVNRMQDKLTKLQHEIVEIKQNREIAKQAYLDKIKELQDNYNKMDNEIKAQYRQSILERFNRFKSQFENSRRRFESGMEELVESIMDKNFVMRDQSMVQRSILMSLYMDYCDAKYFNSFKPCDPATAPLMSDEFSSLLEKINRLRWDTITSEADLPPMTQFTDQNVPMLLIDDSDYMRHITLMKQTGRIQVNLKSLDVHNSLSRYWRMRVKNIKFVLLNSRMDPISSPGTLLGEEIQVSVTYPTVFNDTDSLGNTIGFMAREYTCPADYFTLQGVVRHRSECKADVIFDSDKFQPSLDGLYTVQVANWRELDLDSLDKIGVYMSGSYVARPAPMVLYAFWPRFTYSHHLLL